MRQNGRTNGDETIDKTSLLLVHEAAEVLGISPEAVRSRLHRGTLERHKAEDGTVYVRLDADQSAEERQLNNDRTGERTAQAEELREQIAYLREIIATRDRELEGRSEELAEMRRIVAGMAQANTELARTVRELETPKGPPQEAAGGAQEAETGWDKVYPPEANEGSQTGSQRRQEESEEVRRSWWLRLFGG
jgi:hypothetical protein